MVLACSGVAADGGDSLLALGSVGLLFGASLWATGGPRPRQGVAALVPWFLGASVALLLGGAALDGAAGDALGGLGLLATGLSALATFAHMVGLLRLWSWRSLRERGATLLRIALVAAGLAAAMAVGLLPLAPSDLMSVAFWGLVSLGAFVAEAAALSLGLASPVVFMVPRPFAALRGFHEAILATPGLEEPTLAWTATGAEAWGRVDGVAVRVVLATDRAPPQVAVTAFAPSLPPSLVVVAAGHGQREASLQDPILSRTVDVAGVDDATAHALLHDAHEELLSLLVDRPGSRVAGGVVTVRLTDRLDPGPTRIDGERLRRALVSALPATVALARLLKARAAQLGDDADADVVMEERAARRAAAFRASSQTP